DDQLEEHGSIAPSAFGVGHVRVALHDGRAHARRCLRECRVTEGQTDRVQRPKKALPRTQRAQGCCSGSVRSEVSEGVERPPRWSRRLASSHPSSRDGRISFIEQSNRVHSRVTTPSRFNRVSETTPRRKRGQMHTQATPRGSMHSTTALVCSSKGSSCTRSS